MKLPDEFYDHPNTRTGARPLEWEGGAAYAALLIKPVPTQQQSSQYRCSRHHMLVHSDP